MALREHSAFRFGPSPMKSRLSGTELRKFSSDKSSTHCPWICGDWAAFSRRLLKRDPCLWEILKLIKFLKYFNSMGRRLIKNGRELQNFLISSSRFRSSKGQALNRILRILINWDWIYWSR